MAAFGLFKEPKNIIELFTFDLTSFFMEEDFSEVLCEESDGVFMIEYEKILPWCEHDLFEKVVYRVFNDKKNIIGSNHINVRFQAQGDKLNLENAKNLVNKLHKTYGWDDENRIEWTADDEQDFNNSGLKRQWTLGEGKYIYQVKVNQSKTTGLTLTILFFNNLLHLINQ
ncbi:MAG: hypothetical protein AB7S69_15440 [Salinivirgaceae bacterium]|jgi:hypothetical protein